MTKIRLQWVLLCLPLAACEGTPAGPAPPVGAVEPSLARQNSADCPARCAHPLEFGDGEANAIVLFEEAAIFGRVGSWAVFRWDRESGFRERALDPPVAIVNAHFFGANNWGQIAGSIGTRAVAWEADGGAYELRTDDGVLLDGSAADVNVNSVFVGRGRPVGTSEPLRGFRYHYADGFQWITPGWGGVNDVNDAGTAVGEYAVPDDTSHAFVWSPAAGLLDLGPGHAARISETGYILGSRPQGEWPGQPWIRDPEGSVTYLEPGWEPVALNHWGEAVLRRQSGASDCQLAVWYEGYGMLPLDVPYPDARGCSVAGITSWGDVVATVAVPNGRIGRGGPETSRHVVVWTWAGNESRYVR